MTSLLCRLYRVLLWLLAPADLRREYGPQMEHVFEELIEQARPNGWGAVAAVVWREIRQLTSWVRTLSADEPRSVADRVRSLADRVTVQLRFAARTLLRRPVFTGGAVLTLAAGLGLPAAVYSVARASVLAEIPIPDADRLVVVTGAESTPQWTGRTGISAPELFALRDGTESLTDLAIYSLVANATLTESGQATRLNVAVVSPDYFAVLGGTALLGRAFGDFEERSPEVANVVLAHHTWVRLFGSDPAVIGRTAEMAGVAYQVVGVMPQDFVGTGRGGRLDAWLPIGRAADVFGPGVLQTPSRASFWSIGTLAEGVQLDDAQRELQALHEGFRATATIPAQRTVGTMGMRQFFFGGAERPLTSLALGSLIVLLICSLNMIFLLGLRSEARAREFGVRSALGGSRAMLLESVVVEVVLIAMVGAVAALIVAHFGLWASDFVGLRRFEQPELSADLIAAVGLFSMLLTLLPSLATHRPGPPPTSHGGVVGQSRTSRGWARWVIGAEAALAVVVLVAATLSARSLDRLRAVELGYEPAGLGSVRLSLVGSRHADRPGQRLFARSLSERIQAEGGTAALMGPDMMGRSVTHVTMTPEGLDPSLDENRNRGTWISTTPGSLETMGVQFVSGRDVAWTDQPGDPIATVVSEPLAERLWPGQSAVGRTYHLNGSSSPNAVVVGVVRRARHVARSAQDYTAGDAYFSTEQMPTPSISVLYRESRLGLAEVRSIIGSIDDRVALYDAATMPQRLEGEESGIRLALSLTAVYSAIAVFLTFSAMVTLIATSVSERKSEFAIRSALGATRPGLMWTLGRGVLIALSIGGAVGSLLAWRGVRSLEGFLFGVGASDWSTYLAVLGVLAVAGALSVLVPAAATLSAEPARSIRED